MLTHHAQHAQHTKISRQSVLVGDVALPGELSLSGNAVGIVIFAHGSGSNRHSVRNQFVARVMQSYGMGTLLFDLLTDSEAVDRANVFDIDLLGQRVISALIWLDTRADLASTPVGLFGASTGATAALVAAARMPARVQAVVSRGGRPDLAGRHLVDVRAPTLLIVGTEDREVLSLNQAAMRVLQCPKKMEVVTGASDLFEEPGTLDVAAGLAGHWFESHFLEKGLHPGT